MQIENFSGSAKIAVRIAQSIAADYHNMEFGAAHLLKALVHKEVGLNGFLLSISTDVEFISQWAEVRIEELAKGSLYPNSPKADVLMEKVFLEAEHVRIKLGLDLITPVCLLSALCKPTIGFTPDQLKSFPLKERELLDLYLQNEEILDTIGPVSAASINSSKAAIVKYLIDRVDLAREAKTDTIIGRDKEARMMKEILCRRTKPNVIITGEAGVGKTALIDGFAFDLLQDNVPVMLKNAKLFELDLGALLAGASYKGEVEDRLKSVLSELKQFDKAVLFIDEIHSLVDNNGPAGANIGNLLKPELARGEITVIGATTTEEYRKFIEPEQAFSRRFEILSLLEPNERVAQKMLESLGNKYEIYHGLGIHPETYPACVHLAKRYLKDRRLPDSAFDLLDRTLAATKLMNDTSETVLKKLKDDLAQLEKCSTSLPSVIEDYRWLYRELQEKVSPVLLSWLTEQIQEPLAESVEAYQDYLSTQLNLLIALAAKKAHEVTGHDVAAMVSYKTGIPLGKIQTHEKEKLLNISQYLKKRVIGQDHALSAVSDAILESRSGLNRKGQPIGSFFLLGPTGTGKTELAKSIAEFMFDSERAMIRFDMSEFKEEHSAALLYGAPPGYVGYKEGGLLVNKIRQQPYAVLLFDEIEKAHPSVFDTFLQILDEGHMHDRLGKEGDFSNSLILFTSNIGSEFIAQYAAKGELPTPQQLMETMSGHFRPEFLARLTEIVPFRPIAEQHLIQIFEVQLNGLQQTLAKQGIKLKIDEAAIRMLALTGFDPRYGARQLSTVIRNELRRPISRFIIAGSLNKGDVIQISKQVGQDQLQWKIIPY